MTFENKHKHTYDDFDVVLRMFQIIITLGLILGVVMLAKGDTPNVSIGRHLLYISWFAVAIVSLEAILHHLKAGVYAIITATLVITAVDILVGAATLGGASLGLLVTFVVLSYVWPLWQQFD